MEGILSHFYWSPTIVANYQHLLAFVHWKKVPDFCLNEEQGWNFSLESKPVDRGYAQANNFGLLY